MREVFRTNDLVQLSWARALLSDAGIENEVFDQYTSVIEGNICAIERRLLVLDEDATDAYSILVDAGLHDG